MPPLGGTVSSKTSVDSGFCPWGHNYCLRWGRDRHNNLKCQNSLALVTLIHHEFVCPLLLTQNTHPEGELRRLWKLSRSLLPLSHIS